MIFTASNFDISSSIFCDEQVKIFHVGSTETIFRISANYSCTLRLLTTFVTNRSWSLVYIQHDLCSLNLFSNSSVVANLVPRAFSSTIFKMADRREKTLGKAGITWYKISKNLGDFYHVTFWEKPKQNGGGGEAKHRSKDALTLYTRQRWLRSKIKYYFNGCFDSGAGIFSICKFIPLSYSLYFW